MDDILLAPLRGVMWLGRQIQTAAEAERDDQAPWQQALLETELALEEGRIAPEDYRSRMDEILAELRRIRSERLAQNGAADGSLGVPGLEIELDLGHHGPAPESRP